MVLSIVVRTLCVIALSSQILPSANAQALAMSKDFDCTAWSKIRNENSAKALVQGFLSGMSLMYWTEREGKIGTPRVNPLRELSSIEQAYTWLDKYCQKEPTQHLSIAMNALFWELEMKQQMRVK